MEELLSVKEAARRLGGLSTYTIHAWLVKGKLRRTKVGSRTMIRESELQRVIEDGGKSAGARQIKEDEKFTPYPATWFNEGRYEDEALEPRERKLWAFTDGSPIGRAM